MLRGAKRGGGRGRLKITGVRKGESKNRADNGGLVKIIGKAKTTQKYMEAENIEHDVSPKGGIILNYDNDESHRAVEHCFRTTSTMINPIIDWDEDDVWNFLNYYKCESNPLYKCGKSRVGCVGCPLAGGPQMKEDFIKYPKTRDNYIRAFAKMLQNMETQPSDWKNGVDVLKWWIDERGVIMGQMRLYEPEYLKDIPDDLYKEILKRG